MVNCVFHGHHRTPLTLRLTTKREEGEGGRYSTVSIQPQFSIQGGLSKLGKLTDETGQTDNNLRLNIGLENFEFEFE